MQIYAEDGQIIFKCDYCHEAAIVSGSKKQTPIPDLVESFLSKTRMGMRIPG